jgi:hypothetical protein
MVTHDLLLCFHIQCYIVGCCNAVAVVCGGLFLVGSGVGLESTLIPLVELSYNNGKRLVCTCFDKITAKAALGAYFTY